MIIYMWCGDRNTYISSHITGQYFFIILTMYGVDVYMDEYVLTMIFFPFCFHHWMYEIQKK